MENSTKHHSWLLVSILLVAVAVRVPFTSIPPIVQTIAASLHVSVGSLGILTTLPILAFAIISPFTPLLARKIGIEMSMALGLFTLMVGSGLRVTGGQGLLIGTTILGIGVALLNVLVPAVIAKDYPKQMGSLTGLYVTTLTGMTAIGSAAIPQITRIWNWQMAIWVLTAIVLIAFVGWLPNLRQNAPEVADEQNTTKVAPWRNYRAWLMLLFSGIQSLIFYTSLAWLPTIAVGAGLSTGIAGTLAGLNALIGIPVSLILPNLMVRLKNFRGLLIGLSSAAVVAFIMAIFPVNAVWYWLVINLLTGISTAGLFSYYMTSLGLKTRNATETVSLSGMSQSGGYLIAAVGPAMMGLLFNALGNWDIVLISLIVMVILVFLFGWALERHQYVFDQD